MKTNKKNAMLGVMDAPEFLSLVKDAEAKLALGRPLSREEQIILLAGLLLGQTTRKEVRYGRT